MSRFLKFSIGFVAKFYPVLFLCLILCNFVLSCSVYRYRQPRHFFHTVTNTVYFYSTVTQLLSHASSPTNFVDSSYARSVSEFRCNDFVYYLVDGRPRVQLWGRPYFLGSRTSRGIIVGIFPDMVQLDNGNSIVRADKNEFGTNRDSSVSSFGN